MRSLFQTQPSKSPNDAEKLAWLRLSRTENVGPVTFYQLLEQFGSAQAAIDALPELAKRGGKAKPLFVPHLPVVEKEYRQLQKLGGDIVLAGDGDYSLALAAIHSAPPVLSYIGNIDLMKRSGIAVVGARNASLNGKKFAGKLARELGALGQVIVSGLARGIDTAAHEASLGTGTIAVLGGGIDVIYPEENKKLYEQIAEDGLILAESPLGTAPTPHHFPRRNRIVSGLSQGVVVVEATMRSGSLITARLAGEQGRDVYAVPGHPQDPRAAGPNNLIRDGAILVRHAQDVIEGINNFSGGGFSEPERAPFQYGQAAPAAMDVDDAMREMVLSNLSYHATPVDELIRICQLNIGLLQTILLELELAGRLKRLPGNAVSLIEE
jgi:DNA processing protein